jgi:hydrogenase expression/formation protein HypC
MCLAIPALVVELLPDDMARIELDGVRKEISLALVEDVAVGDYVIVHVGYALQKLDPEEAAETLALFAQLAGALPT